jgi:hypothetical protein
MQKEMRIRMVLLIVFLCGIACLFLSGILPLPKLPGASLRFEQQGPPTGEIVFRARDAKNQTPLEGVTYYIGDTRAGVSDPDGIFLLPAASVPSGMVVVRATRPGYRDHISRIDLAEISTLELDFEESSIHPVLVNGPPDKKIDVVFVPSGTAFNGTTRTKLQYGGYPGGEEQFAADVTRFVNRTFLASPKIMSENASAMENYPEKFNFYYFWDGRTFGDAFDGCAGTIPEQYWDEVTYSDLTILLYPKYYGRYLNPASQPIGCTNANGLGNMYLKIAADQYSLAIHETGHGLYGLMDTYCGNTYYRENDPNPNIWNSEAKCREDAVQRSRDPDGCRRISDDTAGSCQKNFWRWDPDPDIMNEAYYGNFGSASTDRIQGILARY